MADTLLSGWFILVGISVAYVAWDTFRNNPQLVVMKWGWALVTIYTGPINLALYLLACKESRAQKTSGVSHQRRRYLA